MMSETDRDNLVERLVTKLDKIADEKDARATNLPAVEKDNRHFLQGMAHMAREIRNSIASGDWI